jgi:uncharacterized protein (DUF58 family)
LQQAKAKSKFLDMGVLSRLAHLRFGTKHIVEGSYAGRHRSRHRGGAAEFLEHRQYCPGDDLRRLDWKVLGRTGRSYVRVYEDETSLTATMVLDISRSMLFGGRSARDTGGSKLDYARCICAALAQIIIRERDRFGLALASSQLDSYLPAGSTSAQLDAVLSAIEEVEPVPDTALSVPLRELFARLSQRGVLIVVSDFLDDDMERLFAAVKLFRHRHFGVLLLHVLHPQEEKLPMGPAYRFEGLEGEGVRICSPQEVAHLYERRFRSFLTGLRARSIAAGCDYHLLPTTVPYVQHLKKLLVERHG